LTVLPDDGEGAYRNSFYLPGGLEQQARALAKHAASELAPANGRLAIVRPNGTVY